MFLFAEQHQTGKVTFSQCTVPLPAGTSFLEQPGKHLAVDPKSRAIAVAACEGTFLLYSTKSMAIWREESAFRLRHPIIEEQAHKVDGVILKIEFLSSALSDDHHVILLIVFSKGGRTRMSCYERQSLEKGGYSSPGSRFDASMERKKFLVKHRRVETIQPSQ